MSQLSKLEIERLQKIDIAAQEYVVYIKENFKDATGGFFKQLSESLEPVFDWGIVKPGTPVKQLTETGLFLRFNSQDNTLLIWVNDMNVLWPASRCEVVEDNKLQIASVAIHDISKWLHNYAYQVSESDFICKNACDAIFKADKLLNPSPHRNEVLKVHTFNGFGAISDEN